MSFKVVRRFAVSFALAAQVLGSTVAFSSASAQEYSYDPSFEQFYRTAFGKQAADLTAAGFAEVALAPNVVTEDCSGFAGCEYTLMFVHTFTRGEQTVSIMATVFFHPLLAPEVRMFELPRY